VWSAPRSHLAEIVGVLVMRNSDKSARIAGLEKIERAFEIRDQLRDLLEELLLAEKKYTRNDNMSDTSARTVWAEWTLDEVPDYMRSALLMGDVIHKVVSLRRCKRIRT
jgi:hypothetical protein